MLGDAYGAAVVEALSKKELQAMDDQNERERQAERDHDLESAHAMMKEQWKNKEVDYLVLTTQIR